MSATAMMVAGLAVGTVAGRHLLRLVWHFGVRDSRSLRVLVPFFTAVALGIAGGVLGTTWSVLPVWVLFIALSGITTVDLFQYRVPNGIVFPTMVVLLAMITLISLLRDRPGTVGQALVAAGFYGLVMTLLYVISNTMVAGSLGLGDVKLSLPLGLVMGWLSDGYADAMIAVFMAFMLATFFGITMGLTVWGMRRWGNEVLPDPLADPNNRPPGVFPFAPSLALGAAIITLLVPIVG